MKTNAIITACLVALCALFAPVLSAHADSYTYSTTLTNGQPITYSEALGISGWLDKIEVTTEAASTTTVTVATYTDGNMAIDTIYTAAISATSTNGSAVARPRFAPTDNTGTAIAAVGGGTNQSTFTQLTAEYDRPMLGGNLKVALTGTKNDGSCPVVVRVFYSPTQR